MKPPHLWTSAEIALHIMQCIRRDLYACNDNKEPKNG